MKTNHSFTTIILHFVFVTKYRKKFAYLTEAFELIDDQNVDVVAVTHDGLDHIHLLLDFHPSLSVAKFVNKFKSDSSRYFNKKYPGLWPGWQNGYYCASANANSDANIRKYVEEQ